MPGVKLTVEGNGEKRMITTDKNGFYEIYDLPEAEYVLAPEIPPNLKVRFSIPYGFGDLIGYLLAGKKEYPVPVKLQVNKCIQVDFVFNADNRITGRVLNETGGPVENACLGLMSLSHELVKSVLSKCARKDGAYDMKNVPPGRFLLVANSNGRVFNTTPYPTTYYPGTFDRKSADIIEVGTGVTLSNMYIRVPQLEEMVVASGMLLDSAGNAVANGEIEFRTDSEKSVINWYSVVLTDSEGHFSMKIMKGLTGKLYGKILTNTGSSGRCPQMDRRILEKGRIILTDGLYLNADRNREDVQLKYPFPICNEDVRPPLVPKIWEWN